MLSQDQIDHYREQGYVLVSGLFSEAELDALETAFDGIVQRRLANRAQMNATWGSEAWREKYGTQETVILCTHDVQAYDAAWTRALTHDKLTAALSDCIGSPNVQLHHTKLFQKPPEQGSGFPMHQDYPYFPHEKHTMMAAIIHLSDADEDMGCVRVVPGSHKWGPLETWEANHLNPEQYPIEDATPCPAKRGDVVLFNYLTIHGSGLNTSPDTRKTVLVQARDPLDKPSTDAHRSHAQGLMLRGIHPLFEGQTSADGTLSSQVREVAPATAR